MSVKVLSVLVDRESDGRVQVRAPRVGWWAEHPANGSLVGPGSPAGTLRSLHRRFSLRVPDGVTGRVSADRERDRTVPVEFGELLFEVVPAACEGSVEGSSPRGGPGAAGVRGDLPEGARALLSPTDGTFYRRPSPDAPPFVEVGSRVHAGQPVGIVEVMKTFNPIVYGDPGLPEEAEVLEIRAEDAEDVRAGQILIVVR